jgi:WD40 repeat protein/serine/threonine protein kinase
MNERDIFIAALQKQNAADRSGFLHQACGSNVVLRQQVEVLLHEHDDLGSFMESPAGASGGTINHPFSECPSTMIGPYKLLQQIGEGGMGVVYMAEQEQPVRRKVALKIVKSGLDTAQVIARFEAERQALALMDHPNIAKVLDAGTTESGRPYFVMELIKGVPITRFCDEHQLTPRQRLELFIPVCQAVQHAHQKGIIHRDLKPSNVLVALYDDQPVPKVIDFGVAKATSQKLTERTLFTAFGSFIGTLEYMSPEQAKLNALDIDTRSDVYALGVLLYELLTGNTPLEHEQLKQKALDELLRIIREEEPPKPSTRLGYSGERLAMISAQRGTEPTKLGQVLRGELDWIVMKALEKERTRRYETANGLSRDLQDYLADEPVEACPPTAGYRLRKFARKHKAGLATAVGFVALLVLGTVVSAWQAVRATQAEAVALANERQANANAVQAEEKEQEANQQRNEAQQQRDEAQRQRDEVKTLNEKLVAKEQELQRTLYAAHMNLAQHAWEAGGTGRVVELLEQHRPKPGDTDLRDFEWYYLYRLCHSDLLTLKHSSVFSVAFSLDGKRLASSVRGSWDATKKAYVGGGVQVWDAQTGQKLLFLKAPSGPVWRVVYSPDGKRLASDGGGGMVHVWDAQTGQELLSFKGAGWSPVFSPDGKRLASASYDNTVKVWDAQTARELLSLKGHADSVRSLAYSPDGKRLASASYDNTVRVWDAQTGQELLSLQIMPGGNSVAFSPDGKRLAGASGAEVKVWDAQTGQVLLAFKGHTHGVRRVAFSPDGKRLASASDDKTVKVWDAQTGQVLVTFKGHIGDVWDVAFSPDGKRLASASDDKTVKVWDATISPESRAKPGGGKPSEVKVWDARTGQELLSLKGHTGALWSVAFSPDGKRLVSASGNNTVKVWDAQNGQDLLTLTLKGHTGPLYSVAFSPDGKRLASAGGQPGKGEVKVWDAQTGQGLLTLKGHSDRVRSVAFSPDGKRLASGGLDHTVKVWDAQTGQELLALKHGNSVYSLAFSPDGKRLASGTGGGKGMVWDAQTGQELLSLKGHTDRVSGIAFSPDGKRLVSASSDKTVKVWDAQTGEELLSLKGAGGSPVFSPDGHRLGSVSGDGTVTIWDATPLPEKP